MPSMDMDRYVIMGLARAGSTVYATLPLAVPFEASQSVDAALTAVADETGCGQGRLSGDVQNLQALLKSIFPLICACLCISLSLSLSLSLCVSLCARVCLHYSLPSVWAG